jgi:diadenosine tetraphosphate (Ap4A) HIT family hydrolase
MQVGRYLWTTAMTQRDEPAAICYSCEALRGERHISPGERIYTGEHWIVEHAWPTALVGWLVLVLRRHVSALHELTSDEFAEMGMLLARTVHAVHLETGSTKEYLACFAEADHFLHVHIHIVPRANDLPRELQGPSSFALLNPNDTDLASAADVQDFCTRMSRAMTG